MGVFPHYPFDGQLLGSSIFVFSGSQHCGHTCRVLGTKPSARWDGGYQLLAVRVPRHEHFSDDLRRSSQQACGWGSWPSRPKAEQEGSMGQGSLMLPGLGLKSQARRHEVMPKSGQPCEGGVIISVLLMDMPTLQKHE